MASAPRPISAPRLVSAPRLTTRTVGRETVGRETVGREAIQIRSRKTWQQQKDRQKVRHQASKTQSSNAPRKFQQRVAKIFCLFFSLLQDAVLLPLQGCPSCRIGSWRGTTSGPKPAKDCAGIFSLQRDAYAPRQSSRFYFHFFSIARCPRLGDKCHGTPGTDR